MKTYYSAWQIACSFASCCFCDRELPTDTSIRGTTERINFRKAATDFCRERGLVNLQFGKYKSALAEIPTSCAHRSTQVVRLEVNYVR
jgi:hypothetical protein